MEQNEKKSALAGDGKDKARGPNVGIRTPLKSDLSGGEQNWIQSSATPKEGEGE